MGFEQVVNGVEASVQQLYNTRMLTSGLKSQYGVVYLAERDWFLVLSFSQSNFANVFRYHGQ